MQQYENSNREFEQALRLDPKLFEAPYHWARTLIWQGRGEDAIRVLRIAQELRPESYDVVSMVSHAYASIGRTADAEAGRRQSLKMMEERLELNPDDPRAWILSATVYAGMQERERAEEAIRRALAIDDDGLTLYNAACAHALLGDADKALDYLESAIARGWHHGEWLRHDTDFHLLRDNDRFREIASRL
jgi:adenylate cyclase